MSTYHEIMQDRAFHPHVTAVWKTPPKLQRQFNGPPPRPEDVPLRQAAENPELEQSDAGATSEPKLHPLNRLPISAVTKPATPDEGIHVPAAECPDDPRPPTPGYVEDGWATPVQTDESDDESTDDELEQMLLENKPVARPSYGGKGPMLSEAPAETAKPADEDAEPAAEPDEEDARMKAYDEFIKGPPSSDEDEEAAAKARQGGGLGVGPPKRKEPPSSSDEEEPARKKRKKRKKNRKKKREKIEKTEHNDYEKALIEAAKGSFPKRSQSFGSKNIVAGIAKFSMIMHGIEKNACGKKLKKRSNNLLRILGSAQMEAARMEEEHKAAMKAFFDVSREKIHEIIGKISAMEN